MRGNLYYFHGPRYDDDKMSPIMQIMEYGSLVELKDKPFGQEFEDDFHQFALVEVQPALYYRRQYKEMSYNN